MSYSLNSLIKCKGVILGTIIGFIKWDTWSLDYSSHAFFAGRGSLQESGSKWR